MWKRKRIQRLKMRMEKIPKFLQGFRIENNRFLIIFIVGMFWGASGMVATYITDYRASKAMNEQMEYLRELTESSEEAKEAALNDNKEESEHTTEPSESSVTEAIILSKYKELYERNNDLIGWLTIEGTKIDYPVMQTMEDEQYYLHRDFYGEKNKNGCLLLDTDTWTGVGSRKTEYTHLVGGEMVTKKPSTNLIIHGHDMRNGDMFGNLDLYQDKEYGMKHNIICFDSLYEHREYELISVYRSKVYQSDTEIFKYYQFFQADSKEEFDEWNKYIKELQLYDTGVTAEFGDEFITLSCCDSYTEDGRFVVVGKRIN